MNILYSTDLNYVSICGVSVYSFLVNNQFEHSHIYIFEKNLGEQKNKFLELENLFDVEFTFINVDEIENMCKTLHIPPFRNGYMAYARLFADKYIFDEKVLYLDCDTLVTGSLRNLWELDIKDKTFAAVIDCIHSNANIFINRKISDDYFNSGVILFNLKNWKKNNCFEQIIKGFNEIDISRTATCGDQDILNYAIGDKLYKILPAYNAMYITRYFTPLKTYLILQRNEESYYSVEDIEYSKKTPIIKHYSGRDYLRPWNCRNSLSKKENEEWIFYRDKSPWRGFRINNTTSKCLTKLLFFYLNKTPKLICLIHGKYKEINLKIRLIKK